MKVMKEFFRKILKWIAAVGPGIFCIGYTVGTGSVTSMIKAGSQYGCEMLWVLLLSAFFSWVMMEAYGRFAVVTGDTSIHGIKTRIRGGRFWAVLVVVGVVLGQWSCLSGILTITSNAAVEVLSLYIPSLSGADSRVLVLVMAVLIVGIIWVVLNRGNYSLFEKLLTVFVTLMGISFLISMFIEFPPASEIASGFVPRMPASPDMYLFVAAFVGTTMAAPTFVVRPLLIKEKSWGPADLKAQTRDSLTSAILLFIISASIMITATGVLFHEGKSVEKVLDMVYVLEPLAGKFAVALFVVGLVSAGLSSIFPIMMVAPLLIGDYREGRMETKSALFRILTLVAACVGLTIPILGANPIVAQVATQIANVFVLPLVIALMIVLLNKKDVMGPKKASAAMNVAMSLALIFACVVAFTGVIALKNLLLS